MKRIIAIIALIVFGTLSMSAMDQIRVAGISSTTSIKDVTLTLTVNIYDAANTQIWTADVSGVYFDNQGVFSFVLDAGALTYNPVYNVRVLNASGGTILFESRLDKIVLAQSQLGFQINPLEISTDETFYFFGVEVQDGLSRAGIQKSGAGATFMAEDVFYVYDEMGNKTYGVGIDGSVNTEGDITTQANLSVSGKSALQITNIYDELTVMAPMSVEDNATFTANADFQGVKINKEVVGAIEDVTAIASIAPKTPIINIGTMAVNKYLIEGVAGQIVYVVGNTNGFTLEGVTFSIGATYICTEPGVWVCVGKN